jgi:hypothetical protein
MRDVKVIFVSANPVAAELASRQQNQRLYALIA